MNSHNQRQGRRISFSLLLAVFVLSLSTPIKTFSAGPYCGVYCLYGAMKLSGCKAELRQLIKPEYIGSQMGSSLAELKKGAEDFGLNAKTVGNLGGKGLRESPYPVILHVKSSAESSRYDHYVLYVGESAGKSRIFDPPEPVRSVPFYELASIWDGNGLIVSAKPIDLGAIFAPARKRFIFYAAIVVTIILLIRRLRKRWGIAVKSIKGRLGLSVLEGAGLVTASVFCGMFYHFVSDAGFLAHPAATAGVQKAYAGSFIPKVGKAKAEKLLGSETVFIDARYALDYKAGHIEGAVNVPVDANDTESRRRMADIDKDCRLVVYCQSAGCKFAEKVSARLKEAGYYNISIFKGGWNEWENRKGD